MAVESKRNPNPVEKKDRRGRRSVPQKRKNRLEEKKYRERKRLSRMVDRRLKRLSFQVSTGSTWADEKWLNSGSFVVADVYHFCSSLGKCLRYQYLNIQAE